MADRLLLAAFRAWVAAGAAMEIHDHRTWLPGGLRGLVVISGKRSQSVPRRVTASITRSNSARPIIRTRETELSVSPSPLRYASTRRRSTAPRAPLARLVRRFDTRSRRRRSPWRFRRFAGGDLAGGHRFRDASHALPLLMPAVPPISCRDDKKPSPRGRGRRRLLVQCPEGRTDDARRRLMER